MAEWSNAHDSKSCYGQLYGGSRGSLCAKTLAARLLPREILIVIFFLFTFQIFKVEINFLRQSQVVPSGK